jgi:hypothetical protein
MIILIIFETWQISWTFTPRNGNRSTSLPETSNELKLTNVSIEKHDGFYNCSIGSDPQVNDET